VCHPVKNQLRAETNPDMLSAPEILKSTIPAEPISGTSADEAA
jgi:hypothetical protein